MRAQKCAVLAVAMLVGTVGALAAQQGVRGYTPRAPRPASRAYAGLGAIVLRDSALDRFAEQIELTDEQRGQLRELADTYRNENADALDRIERMQEELRALRDGDERPTRQALDEVVERYDHPDLDLVRANRVLDRNARAILTPDQEIILARGARMRVQDPRSRLAVRRVVERRGGRRVRDLIRRSGSRYRQAPISRMRRLRRLQRRPTRP